MTLGGMTRLLAMLLAFAALALAGAACGSDDDGDAAPDPTASEQPASDGEEDEGDEGAQGELEGTDNPAFERDPCELLTDADLRQILGEAVEGRSTPGDPETLTPPHCEWTTGAATDFDDPRANGLSLYVGDEQIFENTRTLAQNGDDYQELDGIGDDAFAGSGEGGVMIGDAAITITPIGINVNDPAAHDLLVDLLERLVENY